MEISKASVVPLLSFTCLIDGQDNVLIFGTPEAPVPKITDFGLSKLDAPDVSAPSVITAAAHFAAPELFGTNADEVVVSAEADVWSVGMTIFQVRHLQSS